MKIKFYKVLDDCLKLICYYSKIVLNIREFISLCTNKSENFEITQVYEIFSSCLTEYLKYFNKQLNSVANVLVKKGNYGTSYIYPSEALNLYYFYRINFHFNRFCRIFKNTIFHSF
jgi:hypothetical protein